MWVGSDVGYNGHRNGVYEKPVSVISRWICDTKTTHDERFSYCLVICLLRNKPGSFKQTEYSESLKNNHLLYIFLLHFFCKDGMIFYINCHNFTDEGAVDTHAADNCFTIGIFF